MKFLVMHITNQKVRFDIFTAEYVLKIDNFDPYNALLSIATNIPIILKTGFVVQGHIY